MCLPIKFRAWDKHIEQMQTVRDIYFDRKTGDTEYFVTKSKFGTHVGNLESHELMQYIGLTDKNGKEVYVGDIVRCSSGCPHVVIFILEHGGNVLGGMPTFYLSGIREGYQWNGSEEVIGNIYENKNILEEE